MTIIQEILLSEFGVHSLSLSLATHLSLRFHYSNNICIYLIDISLYELIIIIEINNTVIAGSFVIVVVTEVIRNLY
jgi:hypothetical protein